MKAVSWPFYSEILAFLVRTKFDRHLFSRFWNFFWFRPIHLYYLLILRVTTFICPLYLIASRHYHYIDDLPESYFWSFYKHTKFEMLMWFPPSDHVILVIQAAVILCCIVGTLGVCVPKAALISAIGISYLNNLQVPITTTDAEIMPYIASLFIFSVLKPDLHISFSDVTKGLYKPRDLSAPAYPFILIQLLYGIIYYTNGKIKLDVGWEWMELTGVYAHGYHWNIISPYLDSSWHMMRNWPDWFFLLGGVTTIYFELTAPIAILFTRLMWIIWPISFVMHGLIYLMCTTSFLMFPVLYLACFMPFIGSFRSIED